MKRIIVVTVILVLLFLCRGSCYRLLVKYKDIGTRPNIEITDPKLITTIEAELTEKTTTTQNLVFTARKITNNTLKFTTTKASKNPNQLIYTQKANCVGYSALFNSILNYGIQKYQLQKDIKAKHKIGQLEFLGVNLHQYLDSPFFKDHDYNEIKNLKTGKTFLVDPSVSDYLGITKIAAKK